MRILLVDDNAMNSALVRAALEQDHLIETVADGHVGFNRALAQRFDLILLDIELPGLRGDVICARLRAAGHHGPIVALTASALPGELEVIGLAGFDLILTKPIDPDDLRAAVEGFAPASRP